MGWDGAGLVHNVQEVVVVQCELEVDEPVPEEEKCGKASSSDASSELGVQKVDRKNAQQVRAST
jgi:hypothetical protein